MGSKPWKSFERKIARTFRGIRIVRPDYGKPDLDVIAEPFGIECKYRKVINYEGALKEAEGYCLFKYSEKKLLPLAVVQRPGTAGKEEAVFSLRLLLDLGIVEDMKISVLDVVLVMPLRNFLQILDRGGIQYGRNSGAESRRKKPNRQGGISGNQVHS
jgi:hypothetical protein